MGFEPTQGDPIGLAGRRLSHSAKVSLRAKSGHCDIIKCKLTRVWCCEILAFHHTPSPVLLAQVWHCSCGLMDKAPPP